MMSVILAISHVVMLSRKAQSSIKTLHVANAVSKPVPIVGFV